MIKFIQEIEKNKEPEFSDVSIDQFFISIDGYLCQKIGETSYNQIASKDGIPCASFSMSCIESTKVKNVLPKVAKIEFQ